MNNFEIDKIFTKIKGGFGNQLFQYAKALELQSKFGGRIYTIPEIHNPLNTKRPYLLDALSNTLKISTIEKLKMNFLRFLVNNCQLIKEKNNFTYQEIIPHKKNILLDGYWQTFKSVSTVKDIIKKQLFKNLILSDQMTKYHKIIKKNHCVAMHIRRGDYISNKFANKFHGVLPISYYLKASNLLKEKLPNILFLIFSDDIEWCKINFNQLSPVYVEKNDMTNQEQAEIFLMSECSHFIIANSSFSWWPAFLSDYHNKFVIYPEQWTLDEVNTIDLLPHEWIKI